MKLDYNDLIYIVLLPTYCTSNGICVLCTIMVLLLMFPEKSCRFPHTLEYKTDILLRLTD